ncbi:MAG: T9SS type A sorting domain-containing protein [candidate division WOR-3 bacterium]|nr:T9SS type A sorting domain-containing protein [candidate division WOR-3 bacterium]
MRLSVICLLLFFSAVNANPIIITYINEIQTAPDNQEAIELHLTPYGFSYPINIGGWTIQSRAGMATINPGIIIPLDGYVIINRSNTTGIFQLNETIDTISLYNNFGWLSDRVIWPYDPTNWQTIPTPPYNGSACLYRSPAWSSMYWDRINWYIDSTPTIGLPNDNWSSISGTVLNSQGQPLINRPVEADGPTGGMTCLTDSNGNYTIAGLGQGKYWITVWNSSNQPAGSYPDSVYVGYSQNVSGINITIPTMSIKKEDSYLAQSLLFSIPNPIKSNSLISLPLKKNLVGKIYDAKGILVKTIPNNQNQFELNLSSGIYFLKINSGKQTFTRKIISIK